MDMTWKRLDELRRASNERGAHADDMPVQEADFVLVDIPSLTWGELRALLDVWEALERRVG